MEWQRPSLTTITLEQRTRGGSARSRVYATLHAEIVSAALPPGRRLSENELALALGVSRTPIREALVRLREDRLVEIVPQFGTFVTRISRRSVEDAHFVREALECAAVRRATALAGEDEIGMLREIVRRQEQTRASQDLDRFYLLDDELHRAFCELSGHELAWTLSQRASYHLNRVRRLSLPLPTYIAEMIAHHGAVVDAIAARDAEGAEQALRHHLRGVVANVAEIESAHPDYFEAGSSS
jgi:GntR family transcriptional regulator, rspAB operon transcriptional repressor